MNNKTYANYLMHGRTKGSRNGISTTKGYTAVGQKAKGKLINGKYVYDDPSMMLGTNQTNNSSNWQQAANATRAEQEQYNRWYGKGTQKVRGMAKPGLDPDLSNGARYDPNLISTITKGFTSTSTSPAYDAVQRKAEKDAIRAKATSLASTGAGRGDAQQAALEQWKKQNQNAIATKKTAEAKAQAAKQPTNIGASQSADLARWSQQNRNNIAASKKAAKQQELIKKADASYAANQGKANNWQAQANTQRAMKEYMNKASDERKAESAKRSASYNKMSSTQKNAMQNDPRYSTGLGANNLAMLYSGPRGKYDYSGKNDSRAPTLITFNGSEKMNRDPYFETWAKSTNKQEVAAAQAKNKEFMNDFRKSKERNSRSDIGNALADAKEDAKNAFKTLKNKFKKKKKK